MVLSDTLEKQMKNTNVSGTYNHLFAGLHENVIQCIGEPAYESCRQESFNCLQLNVRDFKTIEESLKHYVAAEELKGDNQYEVEGGGKRDARKFIRFKTLPPVLQIQLNRFDYNPVRDQMVKINSKFEFGEILDLDAIFPSEVTSHS